MPLLDHFRPPLSRTHPWRSFHGAWAGVIARHLNAGVLPTGYYAVPFLDADGPIEIDVATLREARHAETDADSHPWPDAPGMAVAVEWPAADGARVEVLTDDGDPRLAAAVELVSPRNKDRRPAREAFAGKCAEHLRHGRGVVVVDVVTTRNADLHADLLAALGAAGPPAPGQLSATAYRAVTGPDGGRLLAWPVALEVGRPLPTLPLWLGGDLAVPLDLEATHEAACADLRVPRSATLGASNGHGA